MLSGEAKSSIDIQKMEDLSNNKNIKGNLRLRFLAPDIVERILNGTQPLDMNVQKLIAINTLDWNEQRKILSMPEVHQQGVEALNDFFSEKKPTISELKIVNA